MTATTVTIRIPDGLKEEYLAKLCVYAYAHGWRIRGDRKPICTVNGAKRVIKIYGLGFVEHSLLVTVYDLYLDATEFDRAYGSGAAYEALQIGQKPLVI